MGGSHFLLAQDTKPPLWARRCLRTQISAACQMGWVISNSEPFRIYGHVIGDDCGAAEGEGACVTCQSAVASATGLRTTVDWTG